MMCYDKYPTLEKLYELIVDAATANSNPIVGFLMDKGLFPGSERFRKSQEDMYQYNRGVHLLLVFPSCWLPNHLEYYFQAVACSL